MTNGKSPGKMGQGPGKLGSEKEGGGGVLADMPQETWICQALNIFVNSGEPSDPVNGECASCWSGETEPLGVKVLKITETPETEQEKIKKEKGWGPLEILPPPLAPVFPPAPAPVAFPPASSPAPIPVAAAFSLVAPAMAPAALAPPPLLAQPILVLLLSPPCLPGAMVQGTMNQVCKVRAPIWFPPDDLTSAPLEVLAMVMTSTLTPLSWSVPVLLLNPTLATIPLVTVAPTVQGNSLFRERVSYQSAGISFETQGHPDNPSHTTTPKHSGFRDGENGGCGALAWSRCQEQAGNARFCFEEKIHCGGRCPHLKRNLRAVWEIHLEEKRGGHRL